MIIKTKTLMQLAGKAIARDVGAKYCHVERVINKDDNCAVVMAWYKNFANAWRYIVTKVAWSTDENGKHTICEVGTIKEGDVYDIDGELERQAYATYRDVQRSCARFPAETRNDADVSIYSSVGIPRW